MRSSTRWPPSKEIRPRSSVAAPMGPRVPASTEWPKRRSCASSIMREPRGASDLYYMHSSIVNAKLRVVDIAGAVLVVREAGGLVLDLKKKELDMALTSTARTDLVAVGDRRTLEVLP